jgi:hypothetical protein
MYADGQPMHCGSIPDGHEAFLEGVLATCWAPPAYSMCIRGSFPRDKMTGM